MSREQMAYKLGCHINTLGRFERSDTAPPLDVLERLCELVGAELVIREKGNAGSGEDAGY